MFPDFPLKEYSKSQVEILNDYRIHRVELVFCLEIVKFKEQGKDWKFLEITKWKGIIIKREISY